MNFSLQSVYATPGVLIRARLYAFDGSVYSENAMVEAPAGTYSVNVAIDTPPNSLIAYEVEAKQVTAQTTGAYNASTDIKVPRQPYGFPLNGVWYESAGEVEIITLLRSISEGTAIITPDITSGAFDPTYAETSTFWTHVFSSVGLNITGWTKVSFTVKSFPESEDDNDALLTIVVTNPAAGSTDGIKTHNRNAVLVGEALRAKGIITVDDTDPNAQIRITLLPDALVLPPSPDTIPYRFEINWWDAATIKKPAGRGEFHLSRSVLRGVAAP